jgi:hypothetical protein
MRGHPTHNTTAQPLPLLEEGKGSDPPKTHWSPMPPAPTKMKAPHYWKTPRRGHDVAISCALIFFFAFSRNYLLPGLATALE